MGSPEPPRSAGIGKPPAGIGKNRRRAQRSAFKLWAIALLANMIGIGVAVFVAAKIRAVPAEATTETALRFAYYGTMLVVAFADALLVDELVFGGSFRLTNLQGHSASTLGKSASDKEVAATFKRTAMAFPLTVLACAGLTYLLFNLVNRDFDEYDRNVGRYVSDLRGDAAEDRQRRIDAIDALSMRVRPETLRVLTAQLKREDAEVAAWAAWAIGRQRQIEMRRHVVPKLVAAWKRGEAQLSREALIALARLQHRSISKHLVAELEAELDATKDNPKAEVDPRLPWALGYVQVIDSVPVLERALYHHEPLVQRVAAWSLSQHRDQKGGREVVPMLEARLPSASFETRCAIIHALGVMADERSNLALMHAFDAATPEERFATCEPIMLPIRPDGKEDEQPLFKPRETMAIKILMSMGQMRATSPKYREQVEPWLETLIADESNTLKTREVATSLLNGIRSGTQ